MRQSELTAHMRAAIATAGLLQRPSINATWVQRRCEYPGLSSAYGLLANLSIVLPIYVDHGRWICFNDARDQAAGLVKVLRRRLRELHPGSAIVALSPCEARQIVGVLEEVACRDEPD